MIAAAVAGLALVAAIGLLQDRLLYFPARASVAQMTGDGLQAWPSAADFRGLRADAKGPVRATAIVFHGNAGHAGHRAFYVEALAPLGLRVILAEYPGYGPRDGALGEASFVADAQQTIERARREFGAPLVVIGESIGAGVAAAAAGQRPEGVAALMLITPFDRLASVASHHYPWLPVRWLLRDRYDSAAHLAGFGCPVLVAVAARDEVVPPDFGRALADALTGPKRLVVLEGAGHNDWPARVDRRWWADAVDWLLGTAPDSCRR